MTGPHPQQAGDGQPPGRIEVGSSSFPVVRRAATISTYVIVGVALAVGLGVFGALNARRTATMVSAVPAPRLDPDARSAAPPPLYIPPEPAPPPPPISPEPAPAVPTVQAPPPAAPPQIVYLPPPPQSSLQPITPPRSQGGSVVVIDNTKASQAGATGGDAADAAFNTDRSRAGMLANGASTVAQGTLIPAVLETGFDSTKPGFARALVQRDIYGFDGSRVLIPRGSRLIGEFRSVVAQGQKRALITWTRLIRPEGVTIELASPAVDTVGRNGVKAKVDTHFFERFTGAVLQTVLNIGVGLATRQTQSGVVVALPGSFSSGSSAVTQPAQITPTLSVAPATSIEVFVARDLDFSDVDRR